MPSSEARWASTVEVSIGIVLPLNYARFCAIFNNKLPDLCITLRQFGVAVLFAGAALLVKNLGELLDRLALPGRNLRACRLGVC
jgi:hypothetical protein